MRPGFVGSMTSRVSCRLFFSALLSDVDRKHSSVGVGVPSPVGFDDVMRVL